MRMDRTKLSSLLRPANLPGSRRRGLLAMGALIPFFCCGASAPTGCKPTNTGGNGTIVAGISVIAGVAVATVVLVEVNHSHHTLRGCVTAGSNGMQLETLNDKKTYMLEGNVLDYKIGELVQLHGSKVKLTKDNRGEQVFRVDRLSKDLGPCDASPKPVASVSRLAFGKSGAQATYANQIK